MFLHLRANIQNFTAKIDLLRCCEDFEFSRSKKHTRSYMDFLKEYVEDSFKGFNAFPHLKTSIFPHLARKRRERQKMLRKNLCAKYFFPFIFNAIL